MVKRKVAALEKLDADFASLQYKIRRDPRSYKEEFGRQWQQYEAQREIFLISPSTATPDSIESFHNVIDLIAHVADCYPDDTRSFADDLKTVLVQHHAALHPELRDKIVGSLVLLRRKDLLDSSGLLTTLFPILVASPSKTLRGLLFQKILGDLRTSNARATNHPLNRTVQTVLHNLVTADRASPRALWAVKLTRELWKRRVWTDAKPVEVMKEACLSDNEKVIAGGVRFFLGGDREREEFGDDESSDEEAVDLRKLKHQFGVNKKTKKKERAFKKAVDKVHRADSKKGRPHPLNFSALHLLHDPQGFAESLFSKHLQNTKAKLTLDTKLLVLQLVTRLVGLHKLTVVHLYSWFARFLTPRHQSVTTYLACLAQATHDHVPPDALEPLLVKIADEFVSEGAAAEVCAAGINAIRETCARQPLAMSETLLRDLVQYRKSKDKGVMMAARGLLSLYREVDAGLLRKKDRGKSAAIGFSTGRLRQKRFGEEAVGGIEGLELLERWKEEQRLAEGGGDESEDGDGWNSEEWEVASDDSADSGGWIDVSGDEDVPAPKKRKLSLGGGGGGAAKVNRGGEKEGADEDEVEDEVEDKVEDVVEREVERDEVDEIDRDEDERCKEDGEPDNAEDDGGAGDNVLGNTDNAPGEGYRVSKLATSSILTPADLAKLQELRMEAGIKAALGGAARAGGESASAGRRPEDGLTAEQIELPAKLRKTTKEERLSMAREGKPERAEHKSTQAIRRSRKEAEGKSSTNKEKARKKHMLMTLGKAKSKQKRSLTAVSKILRGHVERAKRGGRRGNGKQ